MSVRQWVEEARLAVEQDSWIGPFPFREGSLVHCSFGER